MSQIKEIKHRSSWLITKAKLAEEAMISDDFIHELELLFFDQQDFDEKAFQAYPLPEILRYLRVSHEVYQDVLLPQIEHTLISLSAQFGLQYPALAALLVFIERYKLELQQHMLIEEQVLFSFVDKMLKGIYSQETKQLVLEHFLYSHNDDVFLALDDLKADIVAVHSGLSENLPFKLLFEQLENFQHDLMIHGLIEDHVFIQKIIAYGQFYFKGA